MLAEGSSDPLLLIEAGVMAMGLNRIHLLYHTVTGDPGDPLYFPLNSVRWHTPPRKIAALVTEAGRKEFVARLFHFGTGERRFPAELFLLEPGEYEVTVARAGDDQPIGRTSVRIVANHRRIDLTLPPRLECVVRVAAVD